MELDCEKKSPITANCDKDEMQKNNPSAPPPSPEELKTSLAEIQRLIPMCLDAMRECLQRFIQHYKALYRMAHYYCHSVTNKVKFVFLSFTLNMSEVIVFQYNTGILVFFSFQNQISSFFKIFCYFYLQIWNSIFSYLPKF